MCLRDTHIHALTHLKNPRSLRFHTKTPLHRHRHNAHQQDPHRAPRAPGIGASRLPRRLRPSRHRRLRRLPQSLPTSRARLLTHGLHAKDLQRVLRARPAVNDKIRERRLRERRAARQGRRIEYLETLPRGPGTAGLVRECERGVEQVATAHEFGGSQNGGSDDYFFNSFDHGIANCC